MRVGVDEDRFAGHGMCLTLCPEVFEMTDDGWAVADPCKHLMYAYVTRISIYGLFYF